MNVWAETRTPAEGVFDLVCWDHHVPPGVLRHTDGAYSVTYGYRGPDLEAATPEQLAVLSQTLTAALDQLGDGWLVHFDMHRRPAPAYPAAGAFPDRFTRALDRERALDFEAAHGYYSAYFLTLANRPAPTPMAAAFSGRSAATAINAREARQVGDFLRAADDLAALLGTQLEIRRLASAEQLRYLRSCLHLDDQPVSVPPYPVGLEALLAGGDYVLGREIEISGRRVVPVAIRNYPEAAAPTALDWLASLAIPFRAVFRYIPLDPATAQAVIGRRAGRWRQASVRWRDFLAALVGPPRDPASAPTAGERRYEPEMVRDSDAARFEIDQQGSSAGYLTAVLLAWDRDPDVAITRAEQLVRELTNRGYGAHIETFNAPEAFLGSLPGHGWYDVRRPMVTHRAAAALAPVTSTWTGHLTHPHPALDGQPPHAVVRSAGSTPFYLCLASRDVQHTLVVGPTGAGKSTLVTFLIAQYFRYPRAQVFSFDRGHSQLLLAEAAGGHHYPLAADDAGNGLRLAPLARVDEPAGFQRALEWIEELIRLQDLPCGPAERTALQRALELLAGSRSRSLSTFLLKVQSEPVRQALRPFTGNGPYAHLFDAEATPLGDAPLNVFELESLLPLRRAVVAPAVLHLFAEIERRLDGRPTLIVAEEAASYLDQTLFARRFRDWLLELRKRNAGLVLVAQMLSTLLDSSLRDAVLENCPVRIFLPNPAAREDHTARAYREFGLNQRQIETVASGIPKRDYYVVSPEGSRRISLDLSPGALAVLGASGPDAREALDGAHARHGEAWLPAFLEGAGHQALADLLSTDGDDR